MTDEGWSRRITHLSLTMIIHKCFYLSAFLRFCFSFFEEFLFRNACLWRKLGSFSGFFHSRDVLVVEVCFALLCFAFFFAEVFKMECEM
jgi:hypothetical protein